MSAVVAESGFPLLPTPFGTLSGVGDIVRCKRLPYRKVSTAVNASERALTLIQKALRQFGSCSLRQVDVVIHEDLILLTGTVRCFYHKQLATAAVFSVDADAQLKNRIQVVALGKQESCNRASFEQTRII